MSEEFRIYCTFRNGTAVDREIFSFPASAAGMYDLRDIFLSYTAFARYKDCYIRRSDSHGHLQCPVQRRIISDYIEFIL